MYINVLISSLDLWNILNLDNQPVFATARWSSCIQKIWLKYKVATRP